jgi:hypothetical protein
MKKVHLAAATVSLGLALAACSTMTPSSYAPSADNNVALRKVTGAKIHIVSMTEMTKFSADCRLAGPIEASGKRTIAQFVQDSFNDELKFANVYADDASAVALDGQLDHAEFSSTSGLTNGWWELSATLKNPKTGKTLSAENRYEFPSGFDAMTACTQTAQALTPAVQGLIKSAVANPEFANLIAQ